MSKATITCSTPDAVIRYTTDKTDPTESSPVYTQPVDFTDEIRAKAWKDGYEASDIAIALALEDDMNITTDNWVFYALPFSSNATSTSDESFRTGIMYHYMIIAGVVAGLWNAEIVDSSTGTCYFCRSATIGEGVTTFKFDDNISCQVSYPSGSSSSDISISNITAGMFVINVLCPEMSVT